MCVIDDIEGGFTVHLSEIVALRTAPAAALCLGLTQRCPLSCRHCSSNSTLGLADLSEAPFRRIVGSFTEDSHPDLVVMSGGESAASVAKAAAGDCQRLLAKEGIQIHGGIGYTWEHDMHLYVRRIKSSEPLFGTSAWHRARIASLLGV